MGNFRGERAGLLDVVRGEVGAEGMWGLGVGKAAKGGGDAFPGKARASLNDRGSLESRGKL